MIDLKKIADAKNQTKYERLDAEFNSKFEEIIHDLVDLITREAVEGNYIFICPLFDFLGNCKSFLWRFESASTLKCRTAYYSKAICSRLNGMGIKCGMDTINPLEDILIANWE